MTSNAVRLIDALARAGVRAPIVRDEQHPDHVFRIRRPGPPGSDPDADTGTVLVEREIIGNRDAHCWAYKVFDPGAVDHTYLVVDTLEHVAAGVAGWIGPHAAQRAAIRDHLNRLLRDTGRDSGRPLEDVVTDYIDRFGLDAPTTLYPAPTALWALLLAGPGVDPETVPLPDGIGRLSAAQVWLCECDAQLTTDTHGRLECETCGNYYDDHGRPLAHPEDLRS